MTAPTLDGLARSYERHLRAERKARKTVQIYLESVGQFSGFLRERRRDLADARRQDLEEFLADLLERRSAATASVRYRALRVFYDWAEEEGEVPESPMRRTKPPAVPDKPVDVLTEEQLRRLLATCAGKDFDARRDTALITLLLDSGGRLAEIAEMHTVDVGVDLDVAMVLGRGQRERALPLGQKTPVELDRYLRVRACHPHATSEWLWLGLRGRLTASGISQVVLRRGGRLACPGGCTRISSGTPARPAGRRQW